MLWTRDVGGPNFNVAYVCLVGCVLAAKPHGPGRPVAWHVGASQHQARVSDLMVGGLPSFPILLSTNMLLAHFLLFANLLWPTVPQMQGRWSGRERKADTHERPTELAFGNNLGVQTIQFTNCTWMLSLFKNADLRNYCKTEEESSYKSLNAEENQCFSAMKGTRNSFYWFFSVFVQREQIIVWVLPDCLWFPKKYGIICYHTASVQPTLLFISFFIQ